MYNKKTKSIILFSILIVALIVPFSAMEVSADKEKKAKNKAHENALKIDKEAKQLIKELKELGEKNDKKSKDKKEDIVKKLKDLEEKLHPNKKEPSKSLQIPSRELTPLEKKYGEVTHGKKVDDLTLQKLEKMISNDPEIKKLLGKDYKLKSHHMYLSENGWQPHLNFHTKNGKHTVAVTLNDNKIVKVDKYKNNRWGSLADTTSNSTEGEWGVNRAFAVQDYNDSSYPVHGLLMMLNVPEYNHTAGDKFGAILVNAPRTWSESEDLCDPDNTTDSYWGQMGFQFDEDGTHLGYTDTAMDCIPEFMSIPFEAGDYLRFHVYVNSTDTWTFWVDNLDDADPPYAYVTHQPPDIGESFPHTVAWYLPESNVWFENAHDSSGWSDGFAQDPQIEIVGFQWKDGLWYYWEDEEKLQVNCEENTDPLTLMNGSGLYAQPPLVFDVSEIEDKCEVPSWLW